MDVSSVGSFSSFPGSSISFTAAQQVQGSAASEISGLLSDSFGTPASATASSGIPGDPGVSEVASMTALLAAYSAAKSMSPVALAYLATPPPSSTTSTY